MDFELTERQRSIQDEIADITEPYDESYWQAHHEPSVFPTELWEDLAAAGIVGLSVPEAYGGSGLGVLEETVMAEAVSRHGAWRIFPPLSRESLGATAVSKYGTDEQKRRFLEPTAAGECHWCQAFTEPDAGLNLPNIETRAERDGDEWVIDGGKIWIGGADLADYGLVLARNESTADVDHPAEALSVFVVPMDTPGLDYEEMRTDTYFPTPVYELDFDGVRIDEEMVLLGADDRFVSLFEALNHERITFSAFVVGAGYHAIEKAAAYAKEREVFDVPIGSHQAIQHPLADAYADLELASTYVKRAASTYDREGASVGIEANVAMLKSGEAAWNACEAAMDVFGGRSIDPEVGVGALWQTIRHLRIIPVTEQMIRNYVSERALDLPTSY
jgi:acyl-CoA dehydrogenase